MPRIGNRELCFMWNVNLRWIPFFFMKRAG